VPNGAPLSSRPRVMLADDYPGMVKAITRLLSLDCDVVGSVADGSAFLDTAQRLQPDVIVLDLHIPNLDSLQACREITHLHPGVKVIMFTAGADPTVVQAFLEAGAAAFCSKQQPRELLSTIKRLCGSGA
jgi:DNA-binding NarL/FixJ family response regulator